MAELDIVQEPGERTGTESTLPQIGSLYQSSFLLASMVAGVSSVCIKQLLLPLQVGVLDPVHATLSFAIISGSGAVAGLVAAPVTGALADHTVSSFGRRRFWILSGLIIGVIGLLVMAWSATIAMLLVGEIIEQIGVDAILSNVTALIPDQVPQQKQANISALNGMAPIVGGTVGLLVVLFFTNTHIIAQGYTLLACVSLLCTGIFLLVLHEPPASHEQVVPFHLGTFLASFVHPLRSKNFICTLASRLLVFLTFTLVGSYLLFSLQDRFHVSATMAAHGVLTYQIASTVALVIAAPLVGMLSHRLERIKPFACAGTLLMTIGVLLLVLVPTWATLYSAGAIFGCGLGLYLGVDIALAIKVLPNAMQRGKDLGIIYTSIFLPLILTPILGTVILNSFPHTFALLFACAGLASLLAAFLILPITSVQ